MSRFWPILDTLGDVAGTAEKLALAGFGSQIAHALVQSARFPDTHLTVTILIPAVDATRQVGREG